MRLLFAVCFMLFMMLPYNAAAQRVGGGDLIFKPKDAKQVIFSHDVHVNVKSVKCTGCHYQVFQMSKDSYEMDMRKITKGEFCGKCHNGQKAFDVKDPNNCGKCHK